MTPSKRTISISFHYVLMLCVIFASSYIPQHTASHLGQLGGLSHAHEEMTVEPSLNVEHFGARTYSYYLSVLGDPERGHSDHSADELSCDLCFTLAHMLAPIIDTQDYWLLLQQRSLVRDSAMVEGLLQGLRYSPRAPPEFLSYQS